MDTVLEDVETQVKNIKENNLTAIKRGKNDWRADLISQARVSQNVLKSLQPCKVLENASVLCEVRSSLRSVAEINKINGLLAVLEQLLGTRINKEGKEIPSSFLKFEEALELFNGFNTEYLSIASDDARRFKHALLHPKFGLCVYILNPEKVDGGYIVLRSDDVELSSFLAQLSDDISKLKSSFMPKGNRFELDKETLQLLLKSMDSEWDKTVVRVVLGVFLSLNELTKLGLEASSVAASTKQVLEIAKECENALIAAEDMVTLNIKSNISKARSEMESKETLVQKKQNEWPEERIIELQEEVDTIHKSIEDMENLVASSTKQHQRRFMMRCKRKAENLIEINRLKRRRLSKQVLGRPKLLDSEDEEFICKAIEEKATYHGRRSEPTMFTNRRVKVRDLLGIANFRRSKQGKAPLKSCITVLNRSRPKNKRSIQARRHIGGGLFCCRKPPKTEVSLNENTHYQRAHKKNVLRSFFSPAGDGQSDYCFARSIDDKAYLRPGTSEGFGSVRNKRILTPSAEEKSRKLPKYDWPEKSVYITPSTHRILHKEAVTVNEEEKLLNKDDTHVVFIRPKALVDSSGTTWANETAELRNVLPDKFEVSSSRNSSVYSSEFRGICARVHDDTKLFLEMTMKDDLAKVARVHHEQDDNRYNTYEKKRLTHLADRLEGSLTSCANNNLSEAESRVLATTVMPKVTEVIDRARSLHDNFTMDLDKIHEEYHQLNMKCEAVLENIADLELPPVKPRWADFSDAGPGVGSNNFEVQFRDAEMAIIYNSDYRIRLHSSRGNSADNEAERTNSAIGDSIVDGATLEWNKFKRFDGLTDEEIANLTMAEFEEHEERRMEKNAWYCAEEVQKRVDGAPVFHEFIKSYLTPKDTFFFNQEYLKEFQSSSSGDQKERVPGYHYIKKIMNFIESHYEIGELYMEYAKDACKLKGEACEKCKSIGWVGPTFSRVPAPYPDVSNPGHYLSVFSTPTTSKDGKPRKIDDFAPRANIKRLFKESKLVSNNSQQIKDAASYLCVKEEHVIQYVKHLEELKYTAALRENERKKKKQADTNKSYDDYNWTEMIENNSLKRLKVMELEKYLKYHSLPTNGKKIDKVKRIKAHFYIHSEGRFAEEDETTSDVSDQSASDLSSDDDSDEDDDDVIRVIDNDDLDESSDLGEISDLEVIRNLTRTTRSGRRTGRIISSRDEDYVFY